MLYTEIMAVCSEIHTKHINALWAERRISECYIWLYIKSKLGFRRLKCDVLAAPSSGLARRENTNRVPSSIPQFVTRDCFEQKPSQCSHPATQRHTTATNHIQQNQRSTPYAVIHGLCSPEDWHNDARNMLRQKLIINHLIVASCWVFSSLFTLRCFLRIFVVVEKQYYTTLSVCVCL
jgi:hypothetical protein